MLILLDFIEIPVINNEQRLRNFTMHATSKLDFGTKVVGFVTVKKKEFNKCPKDGYPVEDNICRAIIFVMAYKGVVDLLEDVCRAGIQIYDITRNQDTMKALIAKHKLKCGSLLN